MQAFILAALKYYLCLLYASVYKSWMMCEAAWDR